MPKAKTKLKVGCSITYEQACAAAEQYEAIGTQIKQLEARRDELKKTFMEFATQYGKANANGSMYITDNRGYQIGSMRRTSYSLDIARAKEFLEKVGLLAEVETARIDEVKLKALVTQGKLDVEAVNALYDAKVTFAASVVSPEKAKEFEVGVVKK